MIKFMKPPKIKVRLSFDISILHGFEANNLYKVQQPANIISYDLKDDEQREKKRLLTFRTDFCCKII